MPFIKLCVVRTGGAPKAYFYHSGILALDQETACNFLEDVVIVVVLCLPAGLIFTRVNLVSTGRFTPK